MRSSDWSSDVCSSDLVTVAASAVPITAELGGRTVAYESSEVRPQVNGLIRKRLFTEGGLVSAGQPLFQIAASLYRAAAQQAEANMASAQASAKAAGAKAKRIETLARMQAIAEQDYKDAVNAGRNRMEEHTSEIKSLNR